MSPPEAAPIVEPSLAQLLHDKLTTAPAPLKLADVLKGLPKPPKPKKVRGQPPPPSADPAAAVRQLLDDEIQVGRAFRYPSGKAGVERYWAKDEKQHLRAEAVRLAADPTPLAKLKTAIGKLVKGTDPGFVEAVVRELIDEDKLYEHPAGKKGGPLFAAYPPAPPPPPPPWYERPKVRKLVDGFLKAAQKLRDGSDATDDDLVTLLREALRGDDEADEPAPAPPAAGQSVAAWAGPVLDAVNAELDGLILKAVADAGARSVLSLADLRREMPPEFRGRAFDAAVLRLADERRVRVYQDADPLQFTPAERAELVSDAAGHLFTTIATRG